MIIVPQSLTARSSRVYGLGVNEYCGVPGLLAHFQQPAASSFLTCAWAKIGAGSATPSAGVATVSPAHPSFGGTKNSRQLVPEPPRLLQPFSQIRQCRR